MRDTILQNIEHLQQRIVNACEGSGRTPKEVKLLLATKTVPAERIRIALQNGCTLIGENKVQELKLKHADLKDLSHEHHFIGHLQTNKIKELLRYDVSCIQSLDRLELAEKLHQRLLLEHKILDVLIQVNTSEEGSKFGVSPEKAVELVRQVAAFETLKIKGLMTISLFSAEAHKVRRCFRLLREMRDKIAGLSISGVSMDELSMGMSGDLEIAIEEGATIIRVGTAIFGERMYPDSYYWNEDKA